MKFTSRSLLALPVLAVPVLSGCGLAGLGGVGLGGVLGNVFVLFLTVGIFFGTLGLGRHNNGNGASSSRADRSQQDR